MDSPSLRPICFCLDEIETHFPERDAVSPRIKCSAVHTCDWRISAIDASLAETAVDTVTMRAEQVQFYSLAHPLNFLQVVFQLACASLLPPA